MTGPALPELCGDEALGYLASRTDFTASPVLHLDPLYRLAHLPLVAPRHPDVIPYAEGKPYSLGQRPEVVSLVIPINGDALASSPGYLELEEALRRSALSAKIDWSILPKRRHVLHATVAGGLTAVPPALSGIRSFEAELRGLFSGNINLGRLYLKLYPEARATGHAVGEIQHALGRPEGNLFVVGLFNLIDHLTREETTELAGLIDRFWSKPILRFRVEKLWLQGTSDDLALQSRLLETVRLG